jgi:RNA polymerase sigma factor (sigma-70 family)
MKGTERQAEAMRDDWAGSDAGCVAARPGAAVAAGEGSGPHETGRSDEALMAAFQQGSPDAFDPLFERYKQPMFGFFWRRVSDRALAEELTQDTFLAVIRAARRYRPEAAFRTYLYAIAFKILHAYRRKAAFRATFFGIAPAHAEPARESGLESQLLIREALRHLDRTDREILLLREFEQLSYGEIADVLGIPMNSVRSRLFRARMGLREILSASNRTARAELRTQEELR